ncbi:MAG: dihydrolipoamide acetyltransferase family protein [Acidimicrobiales bacterium]
MPDITMPQLGETVTEGTITRWFKSVGDTVAEDEVLFEVSTDKVDSEVPSPIAGVLTEIVVAEGDTVDVGTVLARFGDAGDAPAPASAPAQESAPPAEPPPIAEPPAPATAAPEPVVAAAAIPAVSTAPGKLLSPVVRRLVADNGLDVEQLVGSGVGGRITRRDVESAIAEGRGVAKVASGPATAAPSSPAAAPPQAAASGEVQPFSNIRRLTGDHMVMSKATAPHVLTAVEVDYEAVEQVRNNHKAQFKAEEGFSLTYLPFIARALTDALREFPHLNASVVDGGLIPHGDVNLAIAVDLDFQGLLTPVVQSADSKRLRAIAREVSDLATRARSKKLSADEITGGTFTITNAGSYGTMMQFPVISQPQVAILSTDGIKRKPVVVADRFGNESIAIHSVGVLALAWDHRAFDGAYAAAFLAKLREIIETHDWEAEL